MVKADLPKCLRAAEAGDVAHHTGVSQRTDRGGTDCSVEWLVSVGGADHVDVADVKLVVNCVSELGGPVDMDGYQPGGVTP